MPSTDFAAEVTAAGSAVVTMTAGSALPAGKDRARRSPAAMASGFFEELVGGLEAGVDGPDAGGHDRQDDER